MPSITSPSSSNFIPAEDKRELHHDIAWKQHASWIILGLAFLLGTGAGGPVSIRSSTGHPISTSHVSAPAIGRVEGRPMGSLELADRVWTRWTTTASDTNGGPPVP
ncbi:MAG: hypothetical protein C5B60_12095 [Chloroflexi bacterium]|nr:MAG: hypothetical protein C5B60_12095 [Chloroflexota bacterium]